MTAAEGRDTLEHQGAAWLDGLASDAPTPGGGAAAAMTVGLGAALAAMVARRSRRHLADAEADVAAAERLRAEVAPLADADAAAYGRLLVAMRDREGHTGQARGAGTVAAAFVAVTDVPLRVAEIGAEVAALAARLAAGGNPNLRGDAITGALLAEAGTRAAAALVACNVEDGGLDPELVEHARAFAAAATRATATLGPQPPP